MDTNSKDPQFSLHFLETLAEKLRSRIPPIVDIHSITITKQDKMIEGMHYDLRVVIDCLFKNEHGEIVSGIIHCEHQEICTWVCRW
jgi:hypothetical protein